MAAIDLHIHSTASDGSLTPNEILSEASKRGLATIALADHDTIAGLPEAIAAGQQLGIGVVPAAEFNADFGPDEVHILGYGIDYRLPWLQDYFRRAQEKRRQRVSAIVDNLRRIYGFPIDFTAVEQMVGHGVATRGHINKRLLQLGVVASAQEAHEHYTAKGRPAYVERTTADAPEILAMIRRAGGRSVIAHPGRITNQDVIPRLIAAGIDGIECYYWTHSPDEEAYYLSLARRHGILVTGAATAMGPGTTPAARSAWDW